MLSREMYQQHILENYRDPNNFGNILNSSHKASLNNPLCGDDITINLLVINDKLIDIKFEGKGCAISIASASLLTEEVKNMGINQIKDLDTKFVLTLLQIPISPIRLKCALLSLEAIQRAIGDN